MSLTQSKRHPRFDHPPVVEVALGVQFKPLTTLGVPQLGLLWGHFRNRFPKFEHQPPLEHEIERRGVRPQPPIGFRLLDPSSTLVPRLWMISEPGTELLQVQQDRFVRNWRRYHDGTVKYPEYFESLRPRFIDELREFLVFVESERLGDVEFDQCDLTYVNHIEPSGVWTSPADWPNAFPALAPGLAADPRRPLESIGLRTRHELLDEAGSFVGRLHIQLDSALTAPTAAKPEPQPVFVLQLITRGRPPKRGLAGVLEFLDFGHDVIVTTFESITSSAMHRAWGRTE